MIVSLALFTASCQSHELDRDRTLTEREQAEFRELEADYLYGQRDPEPFEEFAARTSSEELRAKAYLYAGLTLQSAEPRTALQHFEQAIQYGSASTQTRAHMQIGYVHSRLGESEAAREAFGAAFDLAVNAETQVEAQLALGRLNLKERPEQAKEQLERVSRNHDYPRFAAEARDLLRTAGLVERHYVVQLGAYQKLKSAEIEQAELAKIGLDTEIVPESDGLFRLYTGEFPSEAAAQTEARRLEQRLSRSALLVKRR